MKKIELFGNSSAHHVWRKQGCANEPQNTIPTVKHGAGSITIWGLYSATGALQRKHNEVKPWIDGVMSLKETEVE